MKSVWNRGNGIERMFKVYSRISRVCMDHWQRVWCFNLEETNATVEERALIRVDGLWSENRDVWIVDEQGSFIFKHYYYQQRGAMSLTCLNA